MIIRFWGVRGSVAVSGPEYSRFGGDTTCVEVASDAGDLVIIDAGTGIRALGNRVVKDGGPRNINMLITHPHWDHLCGFPFFKPLYQSGYSVRVYGLVAAEESLKTTISRTMTPPYFPIELEDISAGISFKKDMKKSFSIGSLRIDTIPLSHTNEGLGYKFTEGGKSFVFLTDNEIGERHKGGIDYCGYVEFVKGVDLLVHDAEFTPKDYLQTKGWGHSLYSDAVRLAVDGNVKSLGLFHHNQDRSDRGVIGIENRAKKMLERLGAGIKCFAVAQGMKKRL